MSIIYMIPIHGLMAIHYVQCILLPAPRLFFAVPGEGGLWGSLGLEEIHDVIDVIYYGYN